MSEATYHETKRRETHAEPVDPLDPGQPREVFNSKGEREIDPATAERLRKLGRLMDSAFRIPGTDYRFGLDPVLGLIPGVGDAISVAMSLYTIEVARRHDYPKFKLLRMVGNLAVDFVIGTIPLVGDVFDFAFKANQRNLQMMGIDPGTPQKPRRRGEKRKG